MEHEQITPTFLLDSLDAAYDEFRYGSLFSITDELEAGTKHSLRCKRAD